MDAPNSDAATPESVVRTLYELLSGLASEPRDWERWRALHASGARLMPIESQTGTRVAQIFTPDEYIASRTPFFSQQDFFEWETDRHELREGRLAHVWSSYEASHPPGGPVIRRGVNSIQLWDDGVRWWILSVAWDAAAAAELTPLATSTARLR